MESERDHSADREPRAPVTGDHHAREASGASQRSAIVCAVTQELTLAETLHLLGLMGRSLPSFITSVSGRDDVLDLVAAPRQVKRLPGPLKLATRLAPTVRASLRVVDVTAGVATLSVDASAGGLPAHKLLGLAASRIESVVAAKGLPSGSVRILPDARIALDVQRLLQARVPGAQVKDLAFRDGIVVLDQVAA